MTDEHAADHAERTTTDHASRDAAVHPEDRTTAPLPAGYLLSTEPPTSAEYVHLREVAGLSPRTPEQAAGALTSSWAWTTIRTEDGALSAMGRTLGDGTWYFHLADIATAPEHRRRGLGRAVMEDLIARIERAAPPHPYITLLADPPGQSLYRALGFVDSAPSLGMRLVR